MSGDIIGVSIGAVLTLLVFSYLLKDTPLFRVAQSIFVGVTIGYATTVAVYLVLVPRLIEPLATDPLTNWIDVLPLILGLVLLLKARTAWSAAGNISVAFLFGVGGALAIGGALGGLLIPQIRATLLSLSPFQNLGTLLNSALLIFGTIGTLLAFRFTSGARRPAARALETAATGWGYVGRWFMLVAFGAIFAGTAVSRISLLVSRMYFLLHDWLQVVP